MLPKEWSEDGAKIFWLSDALNIVQLDLVLFKLLDHKQLEVSKSQSNSVIEVSGVLVEADGVVIITGSAIWGVNLQKSAVKAISSIAISLKKKHLAK